jgi:hypothetical protein
MYSERILKLTIKITGQENAKYFYLDKPMKSYSQFLSEADNQIALLSTELLYTIVLDEANSEEVIIEALNELYIRDELSEADLQKAMSGTIGSVPLSYIAKRKEGIAKQAELEKQSKAPPAKPFRMNEPNTTIAKTPGGLVKFPTKPTDNTKGMALTGKTFDPIKTALRGTVEPKTMPMVKTEPVSQKQVLSKSTPSKTVTRSATSTAAKPIDTSAKSSPKPVTSKSTAPVIPKTKTAETPKPTKSIPKVARSAEKDPNIGRGFVTAGVSKGPSGNLRTVNLSRGKADTTSMPSKISSTKEPLQKARNQSYSKASDWKSPASGQKLAPQGSAQRDSQLAKMGYKKF